MNIPSSDSPESPKTTSSTSTPVISGTASTHPNPAELLLTPTPALPSSNQHKRIFTISQPHRPGRTFKRQTTDTEVNTSYGRSCYKRNYTDLRIFFQNVRGLTYSASGEDYKYYLSSAKSIDADIIGMAETNTAWCHPHLQTLFTSLSRKHFDMATTTFSSPSTVIDPIPDTETYQAGGTATLSTQSMVSMALGPGLMDPSGLGRWSGQTFRGKDGKSLSIITAYRVCKGTITSTSVGSSFNREYEHHRTQGITSPRPRQIILNDLQQLIIKLQEYRNAIVLMMNSNGTLDEDLDLQRFISNCDIHDLHSANPPPSTYIGANDRRIDHMFGCSKVVQNITGAGALPYLEGPQSDHRGLFIDINQMQLLGHTPTETTTPYALSRILKTGNPVLVELYHEAMLKYYTNHNMVARIDDIADNAANMTEQEMKVAMEKWDADHGRAMHFAEKCLSKPRKPYPPILRDTGIIVYRYWRLRLRELKHEEHYHDTFDRMEQLVRQSNPTFALPQRHESLQLDTVKERLNTARKALQKCQLDSTELRFRSYLDLLAVYENDTDPTTKASSVKKAKIVHSTIKSERSRAMHRNIRQVVKPAATGGISKILAPRHRHTQELPDNYQEFIATTDEEDIIWDTILDKESIETNLLRYNRNSFRAAAASLCGSGKIQHQLTYNSLSYPAAEILSGSIQVPSDWKGHSLPYGIRCGLWEKVGDMQMLILVWCP